MCYELVFREGGITVIAIDANINDFILALSLYDFYSDGVKSFYSFAIITDDPNDEVLENRHDSQHLHLLTPHG